MDRVIIAVSRAYQRINGYLLTTLAHAWTDSILTVLMDFVKGVIIRVELALGPKQINASDV